MTIETIEDEGVIFFYDHREQNGWLSNFFMAPVFAYDNVYPTSEHLYQALKNGDGEYMAKVRQAPTAKAAKRIAHELLDHKLSVQEKASIMRMAIRLKFDQNENLRECLIATKCEIVESSETDVLWGIGADGEGLNLMGLLLMDLRSAYHSS